MYQMICYERCSTCAKARKKLDELGIGYKVIDVKQNPPTKEMMLALLQRTPTPHKLFNTSGKVYREMKLSSQIKSFNLQQMAELLGSNGMLIKRPLLFDDQLLLIGYQEQAYEALVK